VPALSSEGIGIAAWNVPSPLPSRIEAVIIDDGEIKPAVPVEVAAHHMCRGEIAKRARLGRPKRPIALARQERHRLKSQRHQIKLAVAIEVSLDHIAGLFPNRIRHLRRERTRTRTQGHRSQHRIPVAGVDEADLARRQHRSERSHVGQQAIAGGRTGK